MLVEKVNHDSKAVKFKDIPIGRAFVEAYRDQKDDETVYVKYSNSHAIGFSSDSANPFAIEFSTKRLCQLVKITLVTYSVA